MPRTAITPVTLVGTYPTLPITANAADVPMMVADTVNLNSVAFASLSKFFVLVQNTGASIYTCTITSAPDAFKRSGDITAYSLDPSDIAVFGPFERTGWLQADNTLYLQANNAAVKFAAIPIP